MKKAMTSKALKALKGSIRKWRDIVTGNGTDRGVMNCPLCAAYRDRSDDCDGCPVAAYSRRGGCERTPYDAWSMHAQRSHPGVWPRPAHGDCPDCRRLAQAELDFLKSLLPSDAP